MCSYATTTEHTGRAAARCIKSNWTKSKGAALGRAFNYMSNADCVGYFFCGGAVGAWLCWPSSFFRASSAFFCSSS